MKIATKLSLVVALLLNISSSVRAQTAPMQLSEVVKALDCVGQTHLSGWKREQVEPFGGSKDVLIYTYVSAGRRVRVAILYHVSDSEAARSFQEFVSGERTKKIENLGDEAFSRGYVESIAMRKGNITAYISAGTDIGNLLPEVEPSETSALTRTEISLLNKNFARMMDKTLSNLSEACRSQLPARY
jgi:HAMP domain-containing protein